MFSNVRTDTHTIMKAIGKREQSGEVVIQVIISPNLHMALIEEAWLYTRTIVEEIRSISMIPVETSTQLYKKNFELITDKGNYRHDA